MSADGSMIPKQGIRKAESLPEQLLKTFLRILSARFAAWARISFRLNNV